jgi:ADP-ribosylglycohydrolase
LTAVAPERRIAGCLLGGAVGDALGAPVEFMSLGEIRQRFGPEGIAELAEAYGRVGAITDDTQMTLFTAEGLMRACVREATEGAADTPAVVRNAYRRWLLTQEDAAGGVDDGWLIGRRELHDRRAPGNTCLGALRNGRPILQSKGCGGVMRAAPAGLLRGRFGGDVFDLGCDVARITHGHPSGFLTAGALALLIDALMRDRTLDQALEEVMDRLSGAGEDAGETAVALHRARQLASRGSPSPERLAELGEGWVAEEALAMGVYCALVAEDFAHAVRLAVNHSGDSDSTGAICGNVLGALHGVDAIPERWVRGVELSGAIAEMAEDWCDLFVAGVDPGSKSGRYPGS